MSDISNPQPELFMPKCTPVQLVDGLDIGRLCLGEGVSFEINRDFEDFEDDESGTEEEVDTSAYEDANFYDFATQRDKRILPIDSPFEELASDMVEVDKEGFVKKKILITGKGPVINSAASVYIHYQMFLEGVPEPFDSSRLRRQRCYFTLGQGSVIPGMEDAVASMRVKELSRFFVFWAKAYGEHGALPRIPPKANIIIEIELLDAVDGPVVANIADPGSTEHLVFAKAMASAKDEHVFGDKLFEKGKIREAIRHYHKALKMCEGIRLKNAKEEEQMVKRKIKLHVNLACCYNNINQAPQACVQSRNALALDPSNVKALFHYGRANLKLSNFERASEFLNKALKLQPTHPDIISDLKELDRKRREVTQEQREFCRRFLS